MQKFVPLQTSQALQAHVENGAGLRFGKRKAFHQRRAGSIRIFRGTNESDHFVYVIDGQAQAFQNMGARFGLA